jgi:glycosidase
MATELPDSRRDRLAARLLRLYGPERAEGARVRLDTLLDAAVEGRAARGWSERDVVLITYGDTLQRAGEPPLRTLGRFARGRLTGAFSAIHILPFYPYSSDDGFSVVDYGRVRDDLGDWDDVETLGRDFRLGFDLVLNHASAGCEWFRQFLANEPPGRDFFVTADPGADLSAVIRPRSLPLLTAFDTVAGRRHVWTTFSADQVDLDFANPELLLAFVEIVLAYAARGAGLLRLDAVAFLWKCVGTNCLHLPETHEVVKLLRDVLEIAAPDTWLLTETNVPHAENVSYFGGGDEAQLVYQFSLPPLLLQALISGDARYLTAWAAGLEPPPPGCGFLNFTASHDGIGMRPLEGLVPAAERDALIDQLRARGVHVATKRDADGGDSPYELNVTYVDALRGESGEPEAIHAARFLASQTVPLALRGIPAVYIQSLFGAHDWTAGVAESGRPRTINRRSWDEDELFARIDRAGSFHHRVFSELLRRIRIRRTLPVFHPDAEQRVLDLGPSLFVVERRSGSDLVLALTNVTAHEVPLPALGPRSEGAGGWLDWLDPGSPARPLGAIRLGPYGCAWLSPAPG